MDEPGVGSSTQFGALVERVHASVLEGGAHPDDDRSLRRTVEAVAPLGTAEEHERILAAVRQRVAGLGPLESLLADPTVDELMMNGPGPVWIERRGRLERTALTVDASSLRMIIARVVDPLGLRADRTAPLVDARLDDGSRVHIAVPPLALDGPYVTIRRFTERPFGIDAFATDRPARLLTEAVRRRRNVVVSGGTGSGKTSLLNALAAHIPADERVVTVEDAAELRLPGRHVVRLEARPPNAEGVGEVTVRTLVRNALRMRPDRIVVGEVRGAEALDMLQAMNTGHEGSMSTCHANSPDDALRRLETMVLMSDVALPLEVVRDHLRAAIDVVVQLVRAPSGSRRVSEVIGLTADDPVPLVRSGRLTGAGDRWMAAG